ncbi:MAG TPA: hypothetical protein VFZ58_05945 [Candidatus Saccharimonadales bacterium]
MSRSRENRFDGYVMRALIKITSDLGCESLAQQQPERILHYICKSPLLMNDLPDADDDARQVVQESLNRLKSRGQISWDIKHTGQQGIELWTIIVAANMLNPN